jgi:hypothetical protein
VGKASAFPFFYQNWNYPEKAFETQSNRATEQKQRIIQVKTRKSLSAFWLCMLFI